MGWIARFYPNMAGDIEQTITPPLSEGDVSFVADLQTGEYGWVVLGGDARWSCAYVLSRRAVLPCAEG